MSPMAKAQIRFGWLMLGIAAFAICNHYYEFKFTYLGNAFFEYVGSFFLWNNVFQLHKDKLVRGFHWSSLAFWTLWGFWNIFYYPSVNDPYSFTAGLFVVVVNSINLTQIGYYLHKEKKGKANETGDSRTS